MPPLPDQPNILKIRMLWDVGDDLHVSTTFHFAYTGTPPTNATCDTIASDIYTPAVTYLVPLFDALTSLEGVTVQDLTSPTSGVGLHMAHTVGTRAGTVLPASTCVLVNLGIGRRYRGGKPRIYFPFGVAADLSAPQAWSPTAVGDFNSGIGDFFGAVAVISVAGCVMAGTQSISQYHGFTAVQNPITGRWRNVPKPRTVAIAPDPILSILVNPKPGSQRRRNLHGT